MVLQVSLFKNGLILAMFFYHNIQAVWQMVYVDRVFHEFIHYEAQIPYFSSCMYEIFANLDR